MMKVMLIVTLFALLDVGRPVNCDEGGSHMMNGRRTLEMVRRYETVYEGLIEGKSLFTTMCYNVLAQELLEKHRNLYQNHIPEALNWKSRKSLLMEQILETNPDVLAMQEVQISHIDTFYKNLEKYGYRGVIKKRTRNNTDGCAVYYKTAMFDLLDWFTVEYHQPNITLLNRDNVALVLLLKHKRSGREIILANTHLLYNTKRWDIRVAQIQILLAEIHRIKGLCNSKIPPAVVLMGDFNSTPRSQELTLLCSGKLQLSQPLLDPAVGINNQCTFSGGKNILYNSDRLFEDEMSKHSYAKPNESCPALPKPGSAEFFKSGVGGNVLTHNLNLSSVYDCYNEKSATTFQNKWIAVDYILYSNLILHSKMRLPNIQECSSLIGPIPNLESPSDHLPLAATFIL